MIFLQIPPDIIKPEDQEIIQQVGWRLGWPGVIIGNVPPVMACGPQPPLEMALEASTTAGGDPGIPSIIGHEQHHISRPLNHISSPVIQESLEELLGLLCNIGDPTYNK